jgi:CheY-like chemotaxis protein
LGVPRESGVEALRELRLVASDRPSRDIRTLRILLADDLDLTRSVTADFLRLAGHTVTEVPDGTAAIDAARTADFDVILTDMRMPIMDGLEATRRIRALRGHRGRTPVVLVTADLAALGKGASGQAGVDLCLMKPFTSAELLTAVATASRLGGTPRDGSRDDQILNKAVLTELKGRLDRTVFADHIQAAMHRIENLIMMLERLDAEESPIVASAVHDLVGIAGLMGLAELSSCLRWFDIAPDRSATIASLREAAAEAVHALRQHQGATVAWAAADGPVRGGEEL